MLSVDTGFDGSLRDQFHRTVSAKVRMGAIPRTSETATRGTARAAGMRMGSEEGGVE